MENRQFKDVAEKMQYEQEQEEYEKITKCEDLEKQLRNFLSSAQKNDKEFTGLQTGLVELDLMLDGIQEGLTLIGGDSHHGKTMLFLNIMLGIADNNVKTLVLFYSLDDPRDLVLPKFLAYYAGESISNFVKKYNMDQLKIKNPKNYGRILNNMEIAANKLVKRKYKIKLLDSGHDMRELDKIKSHILSHKQDDLKICVFIDGFHDIKTKGGDENERTGQLALDLKEFSQKHKIPIVCTAQLRKGDSKAKKRPVSDDIRHGKKIGYEATTIIMVYNDYIARHRTSDVVYYPNHDEEKNYPVVEVHVEKNKKTGGGGFLYYALMGWKAKMIELQKHEFGNYKLKVDSAFMSDKQKG